MHVSKLMAIFTMYATLMLIPTALNAASLASKSVLGGKFEVIGVTRSSITQSDDNIKVIARVSSKGRGGAPLKMMGADLCFGGKNHYGGFSVKQDPSSPDWQNVEITFYVLPKGITSLGFSVDLQLDTSKDVVFVFDKIKPSDTPVTRQSGSTKMTLSRILVNKPLPKGDWNEELVVPGSDTRPSAKLMRVEFDMTYPDGYVNDIGPILVDDRGRDYEAFQMCVDESRSVDVPPFLHNICPPGAAKSSETRPSLPAKPQLYREVAMFVYKAINPAPKWISIKRRGVLPPGDTDKAHISFTKLPVKP